MSRCTSVMSILLLAQVAFAPQQARADEPGEWRTYNHGQALVVFALP